MLWPTELKRRVGKRSASRRYNQLPLLRSSPGGFEGSWPYRTFPCLLYVALHSSCLPCGEGEIRTREPVLPVTRFPGVPLQPLEHLSGDELSEFCGCKSSAFPRYDQINWAKSDGKKKKDGTNGRFLIQNSLNGSASRHRNASHRPWRNGKL